MTTTAVRVALRVKPRSSNDDEQSIISFVKDEQRICIGSDNRPFTFDFVYSPESTQEEVYKSSVIPLLDHFIEGKNITILAYGQPGSGKTYSMGTGSTTSSPSDQGIINRFATSLFDIMLESSSKPLSKNSSQIYVSFLEVYNEDIHDLLATPVEPLHPQYHHSHSVNTASSISSTSTSLDNHPAIREDVQGNIYWTGIKEEKVDSVTELLGFLKKGAQYRTTASTEMNASSSRSHAIFSVVLKQQISNDDISASLVENETLDLPATTKKNLVSKFHFVDLAGSESLKRNNVLDDRQKEDIFINGGLLALGNVISALADESKKKNQHVPYSDSKLTRLLQDSLGGNSYTLMLACVSPSSLDYRETLNTLKYANRARNIQNRVEVNQFFNEGLPEETSYLRSQISRLQTQVSTLRDIQNNTPLENELKMLKEEMTHIKLFSQQTARDLAEAQSERDSLLMKLQQGNDDTSGSLQVHPLIQQYVEEVQALKLQIAETQSKLAAFQQGRHVLDATFDNQHFSREPLKSKSHSSRASTSKGYLDNNSSLFVDDEISKKFPHHLSSSSSRRFNSNKKRPIIHRMKCTHSSSLTKKKSAQHQHQQNMDELLELLRKEYLLEEQDSDRFLRDTDEEIEKIKSTDETILHASHAENPMTMQSLSFREAEFIDDFPSNMTQQNNIMLDTPISPIIPLPINNACFNEDELEALSVPSWSDAPKSQSINGSSKRKSISLDSMWDDTNSSMTTSRVASTETPNHYGRVASNNPSGNQSKSNNMGRQSRNLLKMLHQIQADLLVKRELVGQLEKSEDQYMQMRVNYEERLNELKDHLLEIQNQRDAALKKPGATIIPLTTPTRPQSVLQLRESRQAQDVRSQYEVKIKRLISENQELRKKHTQSTQSIQTARAKAEGIIGRLRADIEALKLDKKQLNRSIKLEVDKSRESMANYERELQQLKRKEAAAVDARKKLEEANEIQGQVLRKRTEETAAVNLQMRQLTNILRRAANEGTYLNEASLEKILNEANGNTPSSSPSPRNNTRRLTSTKQTLSATSPSPIPELQ